MNYINPSKQFEDDDNIDFSQFPALRDSYRLPREVEELFTDKYDMAFLNLEDSEIKDKFLSLPKEEQEFYEQLTKVFMNPFGEADEKKVENKEQSLTADEWNAIQLPAREPLPSVRKRQNRSQGQADVLDRNKKRGSPSFQFDSMPEFNIGTSTRKQKSRREPLLQIDPNRPLSSARQRSRNLRRRV